MYWGSDRDLASLQKGVDYLLDQGPSKNNVYFNYYATQVLNHHQHPEWPRWNKKMREYLIQTQAQRGHELGSWHFREKHGTVGGRLYTTAMCAMTLEIYYRYLPLYDSIDDFPL